MYLPIILGCLAFALFILYDVNSLIWQNRWCSKCFFAGCLLLSGATVMMVAAAAPTANWTHRAAVAALLACGVFLVLLVYTLFFALPFESTYQSTSAADKPIVCQSGVYALCRHPGVLWFAGFYFCLYLAFGDRTLLLAAVLFSMLNVLYVIFQDRWTFVHVFDQYPAYQASTPFLLPTAQSIRRCFATLHQK